MNRYLSAGSPMILMVLSGLTLLAVPCHGAGPCPPDKGIALQVLGSGEPMADDARASSSYLVWVDGTARVMIDAGGGAFPGLVAFVDRMLNPDDGAYAYLSAYLDGSAGLAELELRQVSHEEKQPLSVYHDEQRRLSIDAMHVPHGIVPAIAFRVAIGNAVLVFASDQNDSDARFVGFAKNADVLVMHLAIPEDARGAATRLFE